MKNKKLPVILIAFGIIFMGCSDDRLTNNEKEILANDFTAQILNLASSLNYHENEDSLISIINLAAKDAQTNLKIEISKNEIVELANEIIADKYVDKLNQDSKILRKFIELNFQDFDSGKMSVIQEYNFTHKVFQFYYWKSWKCDLGGRLDLVNHSLDTMLLYEFGNYDIPISINPGNNYQNPFVIISNSLQENNKNEIHIKTGQSEDRIFQENFELIVLNRITGEKFEERKMIKYRVIKKKATEN